MLVTATVGVPPSPPDTESQTALVTITASALLSLMLSQAMESVTRAFYTRSDLDLLLSSPAQAPKIFAVRIATSRCPS
jgi:ABC-2 type transport system permease protein